MDKYTLSSLQLLPFLPFLLLLPVSVCLPNSQITVPDNDWKPCQQRRSPISLMYPGMYPTVTAWSKCSVTTVSDSHTSSRGTGRQTLGGNTVSLEHSHRSIGNDLENTSKNTSLFSTGSNRTSFKIALCTGPTPMIAFQNEVQEGTTLCTMGYL